MAVVTHTVVIELFEGDEMGPNGASVLQEAGLSPPESLASGKSERQIQLRLVNVEGFPFDGGVDDGGGRDWLGIL